MHIDMVAKVIVSGGELGRRWTLGTPGYLGNLCGKNVFIKVDQQINNLDVQCLEKRRSKQ